MKKSVKTFMALSIVFIVLAIACFVGGPLFVQLSNTGEANFMFDKALMNVITAFPTLFNFSGGFSFNQIGALVTLGVLAIVWLVWFIVSICKHHARSSAAVIFGFFTAVALYFLAYVYLFDLWAIEGSSVKSEGQTLLNAMIDNLSSDPKSFPIFLSILGLGCVALSALTLIFFLLEALIDMAAPKNVKVKYQDGRSRDDSIEDEQYDDPEDLRKLLEEDSVASPVEEKPVEEAPKASEPAVANATPAQPTIVNNYYGTMPPYIGQIQPEEKPAEAPAISMDEIREIVRKEVADYDEHRDMVQIMHGELPTGYENELRRIVREEVAKLLVDFTPAVVPAEPVEEPVEEPAVVAPVEEPAPEKAKIVRIPFTTRIKSMDENMRNNFNTLKSEIMSYGVKSRISNSGDTFRLHTKTYVKMIIAGKGLKLYLALDPNSYKDSTIPVIDVSNKGIYKEIPLAFKVKSDLSVRRAKALIAEAMASGGLTQGPVEEKDWIQEIIDSKPEVSEDDADGEEEE